MLGMRSVAVELAGSYDPQETRGVASQTHLLVFPEVLIDPCEVLGGEDFNGPVVTVLHMADGFCRQSHHPKSVL